MKVFGIINEEQFKGYSNSVKSILNEVTDSKEVMDTNNNTIDEIKNTIANSTHTQKTIVLSSADMGARLFETLNNQQNSINNVEYVLASDKFYNLDTSKIKNLSLIMPQEAINEYSKQNSNTKIKKYPADLVAAPSKEDMQNRASDFASLNPVIATKVRDLIANNADTFFIGGRVSLPDGSFKENTPEIFAAAGKMVATQAQNGAIIVFHGLRSFTRGDKTNDFQPYNAFKNALEQYMPKNKEFLLITKNLNEDGVRKSCANLISKSQDNQSDKKDITFPINESKFGAAEYYFLLNEAIKANRPLYATVEQMNFIPEAINLGAKPSDLHPYKWELSVESNIKTYEKLFYEYNKNNRILDTQVSAFKKLLSDIKSNEKTGNNISNTILSQQKQR